MEALVSEGPVLSPNDWKLQCLRRGKENTPAHGVIFFFCPLIFFFPIQALSRLDDDHTHGEGQPFLIHIAH